MTLRKFLGALCLGLPAAVLAHILSFGSGHTLGGAAHELVLDATLGVVCASMAALLAGALSFSTARRSGSIVAARMADFLPGLTSIGLAAAGCFALIERAEPAHSLSLAVVAAAIAGAAWALRVLLTVMLRFVAGLAVAICAHPFLNRPPHVRLSFTSPLETALCPVVATRFSRPPPHFS